MFVLLIAINPVPRKPFSYAELIDKCPTIKLLQVIEHLDQSRCPRRDSPQALPLRSKGWKRYAR
jgi:hypothetical protein